MKNFGKKIVANILGWQVRRLCRRHSLRVVLVAGSIGKTSTKLAIAQTLSAARRVRYQEGNYNDLVSVPLVFFGQVMPNILNPIAWAKIIIANESQIRGKFPYDIVVVEVGTDAPGQIAEFGKYLEAYIAVLTAIAPEHMQNFSDLDAVAAEELMVQDYSKLVFVNSDLTDAKYLKFVENPITYAIEQPADYQAVDYRFTKDGLHFEISKGDKLVVSASHEAISHAQLYSMTAAVAVADELGLSDDEIVSGIAKIKPVSGRLQLLKGIKNSTIIDDSYNSSPEAVKGALEVVYQLEAPQKIVLLGSMNELGEYSEQAHTEIGELCDPSKVDVVVTLGPDANKFLAPAARDIGCQVEEFDSPYDAGEYLKSIIKNDALVLIKGSQNKVFAEEAIKSILNDKSNTSRLVRQSAYWMKIKEQQFS